MSRRYVVLLALLLAVLTAGCRQSRAPAPGQTEGVAPTPVGQISLRLATFAGGAKLNPFQTIIAAYEKDNPNTVVYLDATAQSDYLTRLQTATTAPDIVQVDDGMIQKLIGQGALADLAPTLAACGLDPAAYLPNVTLPGRVGDKLYLLPHSYSPLVIYYNKKLFRQFNVAEPKDGWTWDDFRKTAQALTRRSANNKQMWGVELPAAWADGFEALALANGGRLVSDDGTKYVGYMDSDAVADALQFYADLYQKHKVAPPPVDAAQVGGATQFEAGEAAMRFGDRAVEAALRKNPAIELGVVGLPAGKERANVLFWDGLGLMASSANKEAAGRFLCALAGPQSADVWKDWRLPTLAARGEKGGAASDPAAAVWLGELPYVKPRAAATTAWWAETGQAPLARAIQQVMTGHASAKDALSQAAREAQVALGQKAQ